MITNQAAIKFQTPCDLTATSFEAAKQMLEAAGDRPWCVVASPDALTKRLTDWMWENHRSVSFMAVPRELLSGCYAWALVGYKTSVVSDGVSA